MTNLYVANFVGIGSVPSPPESALHVTGPRAGSASKGIHLGEGGTNDYSIEIVGGSTSANSYIDFSTPLVDYNGRIIYDHSIKQLSILNNGNNITFSSNGNLSIPRLISTNATLTNLISTNLSSSNLTTTSLVFTNAYFVNSSVSNCIITSATISNLIFTNSSITNFITNNFTSSNILQPVLQVRI
jgi:hypothetical protein